MLLISQLWFRNMIVARIGPEFFCGLVKSAGAGLVNYKSFAWYVAQLFTGNPFMRTYYLELVYERTLR